MKDPFAFASSTSIDEAQKIFEQWQREQKQIEASLGPAHAERVRAACAYFESSEQKAERDAAEKASRAYSGGLSRSGPEFGTGYRVTSPPPPPTPIQVVINIVVRPTHDEGDEKTSPKPPGKLN